MNNSRGTMPWRFFDVIMSAFVVILILSNIASSAKIVDLKMSIANIDLIFDGGTLIFPLSYILGDILTEVYGFRASRRVIWTGFGLSALAALVFFVLNLLPGEQAWEAYAGSAAYNSILGGMSAGGIVLASLAGFFAGEFSNSMLLSRIKVLMNGRLLPFRTIVSTLVGEFLDSIIFIGVATLTGVFPPELFWALILTNYVLKCSIEIIFTPLTCLISARLKRAEKIDIFDRGVIYNPFGF
ncbi:MAG: queuosine precursor transporter [Spirochaetaceae bacterium]|jgi:uncharacterized integral membrane protein (TIGR00697 family)|nr:queuosine precursor transporter [Spirochaetaceae bacterium]